MSSTLLSQRTSVAAKQRLAFYKNAYDYYIKLASSLRDKDIVIKCMNAANGVIDMSTYDYVMKPLGNSKKDFNDDLPGELRNTDFITPIKEKNLGEYIELPYKFFVKTNDPEAVLRRDVEVKKELMGLMEESFVKLVEAYQAEERAPELPDIKEYAKEYIADWIDKYAIKGQHTLNLLNDETDFDTRRIQDFYYWWATEEFYTYRYIKNERVIVESVSPLDAFPVRMNSPFAEDFDAFIIRRKTSWNEFLERHGDDLSTEDLTYVEEMTNSYSSTGVLRSKVKWLRVRFGETFDNDMAGRYGGDENDLLFDEGNNTEFNEYVILWKTEEPVYFLTYINVLGETIETEVTADYKLDIENGDISIRKEWRQVEYKGLRFGEEDRGLYLKPERSIVQRYDINTNHVKLSVGGRQGLLEGIPRNPVPLRMVTYLAFDRFLYLQIERVLAKYKGDIMTIPKSMMNPDEAGSSQEKYFYMLADNTLLYDDTLVDLQTVVQGFRVVGNPGLERYLTVLIQLRDSNKREAYDLANMNEERAGATSQNQTVTNATQNIYRAKLGSTLMITMFNKALEREHQADLEFSKVAWINGKEGTYFDHTTNNPITVQVPEEHPFIDYGIYVRNSKIEEKKLEDYRALAFNASQNGEPELASEAINAESTPELRQFIKEYSKAKKEFEQSLEQQKNEAVKYAADKASEDTAKLIQKELDIANIKADSAAEVAYINAMGFNDETKGENTFSDDQILAQAKNAREERKLALAERAQADKVALDKEKLAISKKKSNTKSK